MADEADVVALAYLYTVLRGVCVCDQKIGSV